MDKQNYIISGIEEQAIRKEFRKIRSKIIKTLKEKHVICRKRGGFCSMCGKSPARESRMKVRAGEHNHSNQVLRITEAIGHTNDQFDFIIGSL